MTDLTIDNDGLRLAASVEGPADGEPILFLHGVSMSRDTWHEVSQRLGDRFQRWTLDFRGHGHSEHPGDANYTLDGYRSDAEAVLALIARPTIVVGHSLGACVAGQLAQQPHPLVRAVFLEDPPWYLGEPDAWQQSLFPRVFMIVAARQAEWQAEGAPLQTWLDFTTNTPSPMGGLARDHFSARHLLSHASALQRQDNRIWRNVAGSGNALAAIRTDQPFRVPAMVVAADPRFGAALLEGHPERLAATNPDATIVTYEGSGHNPRRSLAFGERFFGDLQAFLSGLAG